MGVNNIWVIDPLWRRGSDCSKATRPQEWIETSEFVVAGTPIRLSLPEIFAEIGELNVTK